MNVRQALAEKSTLVQSDSAQIDTEILLCFALGKNRTWLRTWPDYQLSETEQKNFLELLVRRQQGEPIAYIIGQRDFWTLTLNTNPSTLIPRPETELLVELALKLLDEKISAKILDLGTGTGAIALAIASERPNDQVFGVDFNAQAVELAVQNADSNQIPNAQFFKSDWYHQIKEMDFDLIVANPPYIVEDDPHLTQGDLLFEPDSALIATDNGLADIKTIVSGAKAFLKNGGALMLEHGFAQGEAVSAIFTEHEFVDVVTEKDLAGLERVTRGVK